jgi:hypothetical protein
MTFRLWHEAQVPERTGGAAVATWPHARSNRRARFGHLRQAWADIRA